MKPPTSNGRADSARFSSQTAPHPHGCRPAARKPCWWLILLLPAALLLATGTVTSSPLEAQERAVLQGLLVNGTADAPAPSGVAVSLHSLADTGGLATTAQATTGAEGGFAFLDVPLAGVTSYAVIADYQGMRYSALLAPEDVGRPLELVVYEATQDLSVVEIEQQALIIADIREREKVLAAVGLVNLANRSDLTLVPDLTNLAGTGQFSFLRFSLPPGAEDLDVQTDLTGGQVIPMGTGFALVAPIPPGEHTISYSVSFPYEGGAVTFRDGLIQGTAVYQVLAPRRLGQIRVSPLPAVPPANIGGAEYRVWEGRDYARGQDLILTLSGLPQPGWLSRVGHRATEESFWHVVIPVALGVALAFALLYGGLKAPHGAAATGEAAPAGALDGRAALVQSVAALDEEFLRGELPEGEYQARREEIKARILGGGP